MGLGFGGAMIIREGGDSVGIATTLIVGNYRNGNARTKHHELHSPTEKVGSGMCTQRSDVKVTYR
jgi:hypothetical protein